VTPSSDDLAREMFRAAAASILGHYRAEASDAELVVASISAALSRSMTEELLDSCRATVVALADMLRGDVGSAQSAARSLAKRLCLERMLQDGAVLVHLRVGEPGVDVPAPFLIQENPHLTLRVGFNLTPPIPDLELRPDALVGTLLFAGRPHRCVVPWSAVFALSMEGSDRGMLWHQDAPPDIIADQAEPEEPTRPKLSLVPMPTRDER
jgi:stringent starvation protein B